MCFNVCCFVENQKYKIYDMRIVRPVDEYVLRKI